MNFIRLSLYIILILPVLSAHAAKPQRTVPTFKGAAIFEAVSASAGVLDQNINSYLSKNKLQTKMATKVVALYSPDERAYVGGAQIAGNPRGIARVSHVLQHTRPIGKEKHPALVFVPTTGSSVASSRGVQGVVVTAVIRQIPSVLSLKFPVAASAKDPKKASPPTYLRDLAPTANRAINPLTLGRGFNTVFVPRNSSDNASYLGGAQVVAGRSAARKVKTVWQYEWTYRSYNITALVPSDSADRTRIKRVDTAGIAALVDIDFYGKPTINDNKYEISAPNTIFGIPIEGDKKTQHTIGTNGNKDAKPQHSVDTRPNKDTKAEHSVDTGANKDSKLEHDVKTGSNSEDGAEHRVDTKKDTSNTPGHGSKTGKKEPLKEGEWGDNGKN